MVRHYSIAVLAYMRSVSVFAPDRRQQPLPVGAFCPLLWLRPALPGPLSGCRRRLRRPRLPPPTVSADCRRPPTPAALETFCSRCRCPSSVYRSPVPATSATAPALPMQSWLAAAAAAGCTVKRPPLLLLPLAPPRWHRHLVPAADRTGCLLPPLTGGTFTVGEGHSAIGVTPFSCFTWSTACE